MDENILHDLLLNNGSRIVMLVLDGLGGLPLQADGPTELEAASTPNLDRLAREGESGLHQPVRAGITPGSGPAHLSLFGYDPVTYQVGRGVLSALGIGFDLRPGDVAARGNFCTIDEEGRITDRRAGRLETEESRKLCEKLSKIDLSGVELFVETEKEYRFVLVLRGDELHAGLADTDPQTVGKPPLKAKPLTPEASATAALVDEFLSKARDILADHPVANMVLTRGFGQIPAWKSMRNRFGLKAAAVADYPMYRGVARLLGMEILGSRGGLEKNLDVLKENWEKFDFFFLHNKPTDSAGEDGDFKRKAILIEEVDDQIPKLMALKPDVLIVTGDHSTPALMKSHSWHPVPTLLWSPWCRPDRVVQFGERDCMAGGLGQRFASTELLPLALAHAGRLKKYGS